MLPGHSLVVVLGAMAALGYSCGSKGQGGLQVWDAIPAICPSSYTAHCRAADKAYRFRSQQPLTVRTLN